MSEFDVLDELFRPSARIPIDATQTRPRITLTEPQMPQSSVEIVNVPSDLIAVNLDDNFHLDSIFQSETGRGFCKRSDYLLISVQHRCALFLEMKTSNASSSDLRKQFQGGECFLDFCDSIVKSFFDEDFLSNYVKRFAALLDTVTAKRPTQEKRPPLNDAPATMLRLKGQKRIQFNQLARLNG